MRRWVVCAVMALGLGAAAPSQSPQQVDNHKQSAQAIATKPANPTVAVQAVQPKQPAKYERPCREPKNDAESELCAQWQAADAAKDSVRWARYQTVLGVLGFLGLLATLAYTARGTQAAADAVEAQVNADRPIMQIDRALLVKQAVSEVPGFVQFKAAIWLKNFGATSCWTERIILRFSAGGPDSSAGDGIGMETRRLSFVGSGMEITQNVHYGIFFSPEHFSWITAHKNVFLWGCTIYRDAGGRRWETGFAGYVILEDDFEGQGFHQYPSDRHWFDRRLPNHKPDDQSRHNS